jgi:hypothetical protein
VSDNTYISYLIEWIGFLDTEATMHVAPEVTRLMAPHLKWNSSQQEQEIKSVRDYFSY